jgi:DNA-binding NarL/FixJ family response regulator
MSILEKAVILVIDDEPFELILINTYLGHLCKQIILQSDVETALALASNKQPHIILLDIVMPGTDGYEVCRRLKSNTETQHIPVIFLSSLINVDNKVKGFEAGAVDYIAKPFDVNEMRVRIESCLKIHQKIFLIHNQPKNPGLTEREMNTLIMYVSGHKRNEIAQTLFVSDNTVKWYLKNIYTKLEVSNRSQLIEKAHELGLIKPNL